MIIAHGLALVVASFLIGVSRLGVCVGGIEKKDEKEFDFWRFEVIPLAIWLRTWKKRS